MVLLVHPLYDVFFKDNPTLLNHKITNDLNDLRNIKRRKQIAQIKKTLSIYGEELLKYKKQPNTLFVLIKPSFLRESDIVFNEYENVSKKNEQHKLVQEMFSVYEKTMERFYKFGQTHLKERFQVSSFDPEFGDKKFLDREVLKKLDSSVKVKSFGEYFSRKEGCVHCWSRFVKEHLVKNKFKVLEVKIIVNKSL